MAWREWKKPTINLGNNNPISSENQSHINNIVHAMNVMGYDVKWGMDVKYCAKVVQRIGGLW